MTAHSEQHDWQVAAFYRFVPLPDFVTLREPLLRACEEARLKGTILLAEEGINGTLSGSAEGIRALFGWLDGDDRLAGIRPRLSVAKEAPFYRMKVRLKKEIVTLGVAGVDPSAQAGEYVTPQQWNTLLDDPDVTVIDTRNDYEVAIGRFEGAVNPHTTSFRDLPDWLAQQDGLDRSKKVAMYCTGGIRCEKSTALLRNRGFDKVYHLQGGILGYLESVPEKDSRWQGECFVFDERVSVGQGLVPGAYTLCRACRHPLSAAERAADEFVDGVQCPHCAAARSDEQRQRYAERQRQAELAEDRGQQHIGAVLKHDKR